MKDSNSFLDIMTVIYVDSSLSLMCSNFV